MSSSILRYVVGVLNSSPIVSSMLSSRVYINAAPMTPTRPYLTLQLIDDVPQMTLDGKANLSRARVQADIFADTYYSAEEICDSVEDAVVTDGDWAHRPLAGGRRSGLEAGIGLHRVSVDFILWHIPHVTSP